MCVLYACICMYIYIYTSIFSVFSGINSVIPYNIPWGKYYYYSLFDTRYNSG